VILESTAPPRTTIDLIGKTLEKTSGLKLNKDFSVAHCPERTNSGTAIADIMGRLNPKIVGGSDEKTTLIVKKIYEHINDKGVIPVKNTTVAEMVKVTEGIYRDVNIALANNVYLLCRELGIDARDVISAANTDAVCHLLSPGPGVGGHCIPVYPYFILKKVKQNKELLTMARKINDNMSHHVITLAKETLQEKNINFKKAKILILGIAYRGGVKETRKSPGLKIAQELSKISDNIFVHDPLFNAEELKKYGLQYKKDFKDIDCIILSANHTEYKKLDWKKIQKELKTKIIIDTINILNVEHIRNLDFAVKRIGYAD
jgi:nucleotide sugar dehydrogenase